MVRCKSAAMSPTNRALSVGTTSFIAATRIEVATYAAGEELPAIATKVAGFSESFFTSPQLLAGLQPAIAQKASAEGALRFLCAVWRDDSHWEFLCDRQVCIRASNGDLDIAAHALGWKREIDGTSELVRNETANKIGAITGFARSLWGRAASLPPRNRQPSGRVVAWSMLPAHRHPAMR